MERQKQQVGVEQLKQGLIRRAAESSGIAATMFRQANRDAAVQAGVTRMLNPTRETGTQNSPSTTETGVGHVTEHYDAEDHPHFKF
eukprot:1224356-Heterocapsa_arctica.AAC.1